MDTLNQHMQLLHNDEGENAEDGFCVGNKNQSRTCRTAVGLTKESVEYVFSFFVMRRLFTLDTMAIFRN